MAAATMLLSGCMKQQATWVPVTVAFEPMIGHDTRAIESVPFPQENSFKVWAVKDSNSELFIDGEQISYNGSSWESSQIWPFDVLNFEAFWPTDLPMEFSPSDGLQLRDFDCSEGNVDILVARASEDMGNDGVTTLRFDHILSRVDFRMLHSLSEGMSVRLKKVTMVGFASKGDYNTKIQHSWSTSSKDFSYVVYDAGETDGIEIEAGIAKYISQEFYVIPQACTAAIEIAYEIRYGVSNWVPQTETIKTVETYWEPSKHYTYTLNLRMDKLTHTTGISSWTNID